MKSDWPYFEDGDPEGTYEHLLVDAVVSNPPYSQSWEPPRQGKTGIQIKIDPRFEYGIAPKSKADYAFLLHDLYHLKNDGVMAIVLPHGVLFRGASGDGSEGSIREQLIENNHIDTIIGLPADIFFGTGIPTIVIILRKDRQENNVLFIDASRGFTKEGKKNKLRASDIRRIVDTHIRRCDVDGFARVVAKEEIRQNGYNLNIPRCTNYSAARTSFCTRALAGVLSERVTQGVTRTRAGRCVSGGWCGGAYTENVRAGCCFVPRCRWWRRPQRRATSIGRASLGVEAFGRGGC